jgi:hypothetical protein
MASNTTVYDKYRNAFEQNCFRLIIEAHQTSLTEKVIQLDWNENDISYELYEKMETNPLRIEKYKIHISTEFRIPKDVIKIKGFADKLPRIDLRMSHFALEEELKCFFEAKRLKEKDSGLKRAYISEGMDRFILEKYPIGCMLGYLLEGEPDETRKGINRLLEKDIRYSEILHHKPNKLFQFYYESNHSKIGILKHIIFDFTVL